MAFSNSDKENPNPIIHTTQKRSRLSQVSDVVLLGSKAIRRYALGSKIPRRAESNDYMNVEATLPIIPTTEERLVSIALSEAAYNSNNTAVDPSVNKVSSYVELLHNAGFPLFQRNQLQKVLSVPSFTPSGMSKTISNSSHIRDVITAHEVFEIIRNIQDPEHPLTLEQLNVVRLELVKVVDVHPDIDDEEIPASENGSGKPKFSTVNVQFT